jgi:GrpB-like predicted nucleotidyltransferase (UPF0157 family)
MLAFRGWLSNDAEDRDVDARTKLSLVQREWKHIEDYAEAKTAVIEEIFGRMAARLHQSQQEKSS